MNCACAAVKLDARAERFELGVQGGRAQPAVDDARLSHAMMA